jgi:hypothetical protein
MEEIEKLLIDNLKETLKSAQTYLLAGTVAALFLLLLALQGRFNQPNEDTVGVPFVGLSAPAITAAFIALAIYVLSGTVVLMLDGSCRRIEEKLRHSKTDGLLDAVLTYPSLIRTSRLMGVGAALMTFLIGTSALISSWYEIHGVSESLLPAVGFSSPYLVLSWRLWRR